MYLLIEYTKSKYSCTESHTNERRRTRKTMEKMSLKWKDLCSLALS